MDNSLFGEKEMTKIEAKFFPKYLYLPGKIILRVGPHSEWWLSIPEAKLLAKKLEKALGRANAKP